MAWMYLLLRLALTVNPDSLAARPITPPNASPRPVKYLLVARQAAPAAYEVTVDACEGKTPWPTMTLPANGQAMAAVADSGRLQVRHCGTAGTTARVEVKVVEPRADGGRRVYSADASLSLGVEKTVALAGDSPEPMCVKVCLRQNPTAAGAAVACTGSIILPPKVANSEMMKSMAALHPMPALSASAWPTGVQPPIHRCSPSTACTMPAPLPMPATPVPQIPPPLACPVPSVVPCAYIPALAATKTVRLVTESGKTKIEILAGTLRSKAVRMTVEEGLAGTVRLAAGKKRVHVSGHEWKAEADKAELGADGTVTLHGHCKLKCDKLGAGATLAGEKLTFHVRGGRFVDLAK